MTVNIGAANIAKIRLAEQSGNPATPPNGFGYLYEKNDGGLYFINDAASVVGPMAVAAIISSGTAQLLAAVSQISFQRNLTVSVTGTVAFVNGPITIGASYAQGFGQSIPNSTVTIIDYGTKLFDTHNAVTTGTAWKFTVPAGAEGVYSVSANLLFTNSTAWAVGESANISVYKNGAAGPNIDRYESELLGVDHFVGLNGKIDILCAGGDYLDVRVQQLSGGALALINNTGWNHVSIHKAT